MRIDLPHEPPRRSEPPAVAPLEPSPLEQRREQLHERMEQRRMPEIPRPRRERSPDNRSRSVSHDRPVERRQKRDRLPRQAIGVSLREEERRLLSDVGRFRVIATRDLAESVYGGHTRQMQQDLRYLREQGLVEVDTVRARRDGRGGRVERIEVVTLTKNGRSVARQTSGLPENQKLYYGMVKPREVEHDTQIYRAYQKEAEKIEGTGGSNLRVKLDFELKSQVQKAIYTERKTDPARDMGEIKQQVAKQFDLPFVDGKIQIPDARLEYDLPRDVKQDADERSRTGHADIEVLTAAYRPGHLRAKAQAGFHVYASSSDRATLTAKIEDDHHLMRSILEL
jgi:DNA-binding transcriptional ArsR family regulator